MLMSPGPLRYLVFRSKYMLKKTTQGKNKGLIEDIKVKATYEIQLVVNEDC